MVDTDKLLRTAVDAARPVLDRLGVAAAPLRGLSDARRAVTVGRGTPEVEAILADPEQLAVVFAGPVHPGGGPGSWVLPDRGRARVELRPGPGGSTEVRVSVHLDEGTGDGGPRYADNAGVVALRAAHRIKSLAETGEVATLAGNPAGRPEPDPYGD